MLPKYFVCYYTYSYDYVSGVEVILSSADFVYFHYVYRQLAAYIVGILWYVACVSVRCICQIRVKCVGAVGTF